MKNERGIEYDREGSTKYAGNTFQTCATMRGIEATKGQEGLWIVECADEFAVLAIAQAGSDCVHHVQADKYDALIDLSEWPQHLGFGDWFKKWAKKWNIEVLD